MELKIEAGKEVKRVRQIMENLEVIDSKKADSLLKVMKSYYKDCLSFYEKKQYLQSLETAFIVWAYTLNPALVLKKRAIQELADCVTS